MSSWQIPIEWLKIFHGVIPTIDKPEHTVTPRDKLFWTGVALFIYIICCQIPLYGPRVIEAGYDPLEYMRKMLASQKGTLMEFGVGPLFTTSMFLQLLRLGEAFTFDSSDRDHWDMWESFEKFCVMCLCAFQASIAVYSGMYGDVDMATSCLIVVQLTFAGYLVILFDDLLTRGYGFGSATSMYIACSHAERIVWDMFSPTTINLGSGPQFEGAVINVFHQLVTQGDKMQALRQAFYREDLTNLVEIFSTMIMVVITIYLSAIRVELPLTRSNYRGEKIEPYQIKLMYAGNYPIILYHSLLNNLYMVARIIERRKSYKFIHLLVGKFGPNDSGRMVPQSGSVFWFTSPSKFSSILRQPWIELTRMALVIVVIAAFASAWTEVNGTSAKDVSKQLKKSGLTIKGYRAKSLYKVLNRYIPICSYLGGATLGMITIIATLLGSVSSGSGTLMAVGIVIRMWEKIATATGKGAGDLISHNIDDLFNGRWNF